MKCVEGMGGRGLVVRVLALMLTRSKVCVCLSVGPAKGPVRGGNQREQSWTPISCVVPCHSANRSPTRELARTQTQSSLKLHTHRRTFKVHTKK